MTRAGAQPDTQSDQWPLSMGFSMCLILPEVLPALEVPHLSRFPKKILYQSKNGTAFHLSLRE